MSNNHKKIEIQTYRFQQTLSIPLERCVILLASKNRLSQLIDLDSSGVHVEAGITKINDTQYEFRLRLGGRLQLYRSTFIQVEVKGVLVPADESRTVVTYDKKISWTYIFLIYGAALLIGLAFSFTSGLTGIALLIVLVIGINAAQEAITARDYLEALSAYINALDLTE